MTRMARIVVPGCPHHLTQRGNRRQPTFFQEADYAFYLTVMAEECQQYGVEIWAYCLMSNHTHLAAVPETAMSLHLAIGEAHRRYTSWINAREQWTGHLWQGRFASYPLESTHYTNAICYIEQNPLRVGLVTHAWEYPWSSARARILGIADPLLCSSANELLLQDWSALLAAEVPPETLETFRQHARTGRPLGSLEFLELLETQTGRIICPQKRGPKAKGDER